MHHARRHCETQLFVHLVRGNPRLEQEIASGILQLTKIRIELICGIEVEVEEKTLGRSNRDLRGPGTGRVRKQREAWLVDLGPARRISFFLVEE